MSEHDINLVTGQAGSVVAENQHVTLGTASSAVTPSTAMAMIGINQNQALDLDANVKLAKSKLETISANVGGAYSADQVTAATTAQSMLAVSVKAFRERSGGERQRCIRLDLPDGLAQ